MKSTLKIIALTFLFVFITNIFVFADTNKITLPIEATEQYSKCTELFKLINAERTSRGKAPYKLDATLSEYAFQRAYEITAVFSHQRPNTGDFEGESLLYGEIIACGYGTPEAVLKGWMESPWHRPTVISDQETYCGVACITNSQTYQHYGTYWVVLTSRTPLNIYNTLPPTSGQQVKKRTFDLDLSNRVFNVEFTRFPTSIHFGEPDSNPFAIRDPYSDKTASYKIPASYLNFEVADPSILKIDTATGNVIPLKKGKTIVYVSFKGHPTPKTGVELTVSGPSLDNLSCDIEKIGNSRTKADAKVTVKFKNKVLTEGTDYRVEYILNGNEATVKVYLINNYELDPLYGGTGLYDLKHFWYENIVPTPTPTATPTPKPTATPTPKPTPTTLKAPVLTSFSNNNNGICIFWDKVANATKYEVYRKDGNKWSLLGSTQKTSYVDTTTKGKSGQTFIYSVAAYSGGKNSEKSKELSTSRLDTPTVKLENSTKGIQIKWNKVNGATVYRVYRKDSGKWVQIKKTSGSAYTDIKANGKSGQTLTYMVRAYNKNTKSSYLTSGTKLKRLDNPKVTLTNVTTGIKVSWKKVTGANGYYIYKATSNGKWKKIGTTTKTSYLNKSCNNYNGTTFKFAVQAYNNNGTLSSYDKDNFAVRLKPVTLSATTSSGYYLAKRIRLTWNSNPNATGYELQSSDRADFKPADRFILKNINEEQRESSRIGKTLYFRVRPYKKVNGVNKYGTWSNVYKWNI